MSDTLCREACVLIQELMECYVSRGAAEIEEMYQYLSPDILVIGTGRHEFYTNLESLKAGLEKDQEEAKDIEFIIKNEWFKAKQITEDCCVVYGEFEACENNIEGKKVIINMDTRITAEVHRRPDGSLVVGSLHHSIPYVYQNEGEYYPKTFADIAEEALRRSEILEKSIQLDSLTGLYNRKYTEKHINRMLTDDKTGGLMLMIDLDEFKRVNDEKGHLVGDELLKKVSGILAREAAQASEIAGRIGGDEFMVFLPGDRSIEEGDRLADYLIESIGNVFSGIGLDQSCSIGIARAEIEGEDFESLYHKADAALYESKALGKRTFQWNSKK